MTSWWLSRRFEELCSACLRNVSHPVAGSSHKLWSGEGGAWVKSCRTGPLPSARNGLRITQDGKSITIFLFMVSMEVELEVAFWMVVSYL